MSIAVNSPLNFGYTEFCLDENAENYGFITPPSPKILSLFKQDSL